MDVDLATLQREYGDPHDELDQLTVTVVWVGPALSRLGS